ncbi:MAG: stage II sporulation protein M [Proteobacteria bacterium]|nr:stage II sporulation protein M [Pseudomonadota bacterium]
MIIDLNAFIREEKPYWTELEDLLDRMGRDGAFHLDLDGVHRFHYLYQRASSDLSRMINFSAEQAIRVYLETLVARAFAEIHETRKRGRSFSLLAWFFKEFPQTFRRRIMAFWVSVAIMGAGCLFGTLAIAVDPQAKEALMPFAHLQGDPTDRVAFEENAKKDRMAGHKSSFSSQLIANNTRVSIFAMGLGITWGIGTLILLFSNGVMLGAVVADYVLAGQTPFLIGWLLPHGSIEIPAIVLAGQAGLVLASALIGWGKPMGLRTRLRKVAPDLVTLIGGVSVMLIWAGFVEAFLSQYHEPVISYSTKIAFGVAELLLLTVFLARSGRTKREKQP